MDLTAKPQQTTGTVVRVGQSAPVSNTVTRESRSLGVFVEAAKTIHQRASDLLRSANERSHSSNSKG